VRTFEALDEDQRVSFAAELAEHWTSRHRAGGAPTEVDAEYLEVVAVRRRSLPPGTTCFNVPGGCGRDPVLVDQHVSWGDLRLRP
jgi:hypothetical protein